jgi:hypothetical protein
METGAQNQEKLNELVLKLAEAVMRMSGGDSLPYESYTDIQRRLEELKPAYNAATGTRPDTLDKNVIYPVPGHEQPHAGE